MIPKDIDNPKTLGDKQRLFAYLLGLLIARAYKNGYALSMGDVFDADGDGGHMKNSVHDLKLAADLNLFSRVNGKWVYHTSAEAHAGLGAYWKSLHPLCRWGGDFASKDGNHYSLTHGGRA
jgi:hypothetical protein